MSIIDNALIFAYRAHESVNHVRKYTNEPYIVHPIAVAGLVKTYGGSENQIAAALLHDVVEDTPYSIFEIHDEFGQEIADIVDGLTDVSKPEDGNRATRKAIDREHTLAQSDEVLFVKCADLIHNTQSIISHDEDFADVYMREKELLLNGMVSMKETNIWKKAMTQVLAWKEYKCLIDE